MAQDVIVEHYDEDTGVIVAPDEPAFVDEEDGPVVVEEYPDVPPARYEPPVYGWISEAPANCGTFKYWNGERCADAALWPGRIAARPLALLSREMRPDALRSKGCRAFRFDSEGNDSRAAWKDAARSWPWRPLIHAPRDRTRHDQGLGGDDSRAAWIGSRHDQGFLLKADDFTRGTEGCGTIIGR